MKRMAVGCLLLVLSLVLCACGKADDYDAAVALMEAENYESAIAAFSELGDYEDSDQRLEECTDAIAYAEASLLLEQGNYAEAQILFEKLGNYEDSSEKAKHCAEEILYSSAVALAEAGNYTEAVDAFFQLENPYTFKDSKQHLNLCQIHIMLSDPAFAGIEKHMGMSFRAEDLESGISEVGGTGIGPDALHIQFFTHNYDLLEGDCMIQMQSGLHLQLPMSYGELYDRGWQATSDVMWGPFSFLDSDLQDSFPDIGPVRLSFGNTAGESIQVTVGHPKTEAVTLGQAPVKQFEVYDCYDLCGITSESDIADVLETFGVPYCVEQIIYSGNPEDAGVLTFEYFGNIEERNGGYLRFSFSSLTGSLNCVGYALEAIETHI